MDYCNSLLIDLPLTHIQRLQSVQNAAARLIFNLRRCGHITDAIINLHWLRVPERIAFKVATHCMVPHHLTWRPRSHVSPTCRTDAGSGPPPLNNLTCRSDLSSVNYRRSCLSCCCSKGVEWPAKRSYVGLVAVGVQKQAEYVLVPPLLRNCLTFNYIPLS